MDMTKHILGGPSSDPQDEQDDEGKRRHGRQKCERNDYGDLRYDGVHIHPRY